MKIDHFQWKSWIFRISQWFLGNLGVYLIHPPKLCAGLVPPAATRCRYGSVICANCGDSRAVLSRGGRVVTTALWRLHVQMLSGVHRDACTVNTGPRERPNVSDTLLSWVSQSLHPRSDWKCALSLQPVPSAGGTEPRPQAEPGPREEPHRGGRRLRGAAPRNPATMLGHR